MSGGTSSLPPPQCIHPARRVVMQADSQASSQVVWAGRQWCLRAHVCACVLSHGGVGRDCLALPCRPSSAACGHLGGLPLTFAQLLKLFKNGLSPPPAHTHIHMHTVHPASGGAAAVLRWHRVAQQHAAVHLWPVPPAVFRILTTSATHHKKEV